MFQQSIHNPNPSFYLSNYSYTYSYSPIITDSLVNNSKSCYRWTPEYLAPFSGVKINLSVSLWVPQSRKPFAEGQEDLAVAVCHWRIEIFTRKHMMLMVVFSSSSVWDSWRPSASLFCPDWFYLPDYICFTVLLIIILNNSFIWFTKMHSWSAWAWFLLHCIFFLG